MPIYDCGDPDCMPCDSAFRQPQQPAGKPAVVEQLRLGLERDFIPNFVVKHAADEIDRIHSAILDYAAHQPIDLKSAREIQQDLRAIAGQRHPHVKSIGNDCCLICHQDLRHEIHLRWDEKE